MPDALLGIAVACRVNPGKPGFARLERAALAEAQAWVVRVLAELATQERPIAGGWPGTVSEARTLVISRIASPSTAATPISDADVDQLVRITYESAKRAWLAQAVPNPAL